MTASLEQMVRSRDPQTSWDAAASISDDVLNELESFIVSSLRELPMADHELVEHAVWNFKFLVSPQRIRTVRKYLELGGFVEWNGGHHRTGSGRLARVFQATR